MGAVSDLVDVYRGYIASIDDALQKAQANLALASFDAAATSYLRIIAASASSYSDTGGQVMKRREEAAKRTMDSAQSRLDSMLGFASGTTLVDMGGAQN